MTQFARISGGVVAEIIDPPHGVPVDQMFHPDVVAALVPVPDPGEVAPGWGWDGVGFTPPAPPAPVVPREVTNFQARAVLAQMPGSAPGRTLFQDVDDALRDQGGIAWQAWEYANTISRGGALVGAMAAQMGITEQQLDALFIAAAAIEA